MSILGLIAQFVFILLVAPLATGLVRFFKARLQGRKGASPLLPYITLGTLLKKEMVIPKAGSWIFNASPFAVLASALGLALVVPTIFHGSALSWASDFLVVAGILMLGSIFLVLGGIDPGSAFGGMGSSREMAIAAILEPTLILIFGTYSLITGSFTVDGMLSHSLVLSNPFLLLTIAGLVFLMLGENARYPVDNPATHLELTMVHEAMVLEYSGPYLAMLEYASSIKLVVFSLLLGNFIFPSSLIASNAGISGVMFGLIIVLVKVSVIMFLLALLESTIVKMRFYRMNEYASVAFFFAFFGMVSAVIMRVMNISVDYYAFFAILAVFFTVFLFGNVRIRSVMRYYVLTSLSIAAVAFSLGFVDEKDSTHLFFFAAGTVLVKVILVPNLFSYIMRRHKSPVEKLQTFLKPVSSYFLAVGILIVAFWVMKTTFFFQNITLASILYASVSLVMLGVFKMVVNRNVFSQIVGLLVLENGLALFTLVTIKTFPILIEMSVFAITLASVFILSKLSAGIRELHGSLDTEELRNLTD